jgi:hypothetical protein
VRRWSTVGCLCMGVLIRMLEYKRGGVVRDEEVVRECKGWSLLPGSMACSKGNTWETDGTRQGVCVPALGFRLRGLFV